MANFLRIRPTFCGWTYVETDVQYFNVRMYGWADIETGFITSTNYNNNNLLSMSSQQH